MLVQMLLFVVFWILVSQIRHATAESIPKSLTLGSHYLGSCRRSHRQDRLQTRLGNLVSITYFFLPDMRSPRNQRLYQFVCGFFVCPWFAFSQTMISEVSPLPQMSVFQSFCLLRLKSYMAAVLLIGSSSFLCSLW